MIALATHIDGVILPLRAQPGARKNGIQGVINGSLKVSVTAPPEDGRANEALLNLLRKQLRLKRSQVSLVGGATSREKKFLIRDMTMESLQTTLAEWSD
jgi:uncharacterized protein (TIGR00251 family)